MTVTVTVTVTDYEKVKDLLAQLNIGFEEYASFDKNSKIICCHEGMNNVSGYPGSFIEFTFDNSGKFLDMGAGE